MKRASRPTGSMIAVALLIVIAIRYYDYLVARNFIIYANVVCNPDIEECFVSDCDPTEDLGCDGLPYKKVQISASEAPACTIEHNCEYFYCEDFSSCVVAYCSSQVLDVGESCQGPVAIPAEEPE